MKELRAVIDAAHKAQSAGIPAALATVVAVRGSSYRRPGARMLIQKNGATIGGVSGGCLEADVIECAAHMMRDGQPVTVTYDTTDDDDILTGVGLGCQGVVQILIEPLPASVPSGFLTALGRLLQKRQPGVLATVFGVQQETSIRLGERQLLADNVICWNEITDPALSARIEADARTVLVTCRSRTERYAFAGGAVEVFLETLLPPPSLLVCGAGNDAQPLVQFAKGLGWHVTVSDARPAFAVSARFPEADAIVVSTPEELPSRVTLDDRTAVVVMTHNYLRDRALLGTLLPSPACYIGVLGPKRRRDCLQQDLHDEGLSLKHLDRLRGPIGLDIGADGPEQIALSMVAEIQGAFTGRSGGPLSLRQGPIYKLPEVVVSDDRPTVPFDRITCPL